MPKPVLFGFGTTSKRRRWKVGEKPELMIAALVGGNGVVGLVLLTVFRFSLPWVLQPNRFCPLLGVQTTPLLLGVQLELRHLAECSASASHLPIEKGKMMFCGFFLKIALTPSFSSSVPPGKAVVGRSLAQEPGAATPIALRKKDRVPEEVWGIKTTGLPLLPPGSWFQLVTLHS